MKKTLFAALALSASLIGSPVYAMSDTPGGGYTETKYPIVLAHGLFGFDSILGVDYWYKVPETLKQDGAKVYLTAVANSNSPEIRGEQLIKEIERVLAITGAKKVNIIGHSHGGPTSRYVASVRPDLVASVTSISGVNKGTPVADVVYDVYHSSKPVGWVLENGVNALANVIDYLSGGGYDQDIVASVTSMTTAQSQAFNRRHPQAVPTTSCGEGAYKVNGVHYYSWAGDKQLTNALDITDVAMAATGLLFPKGERNDGLVGACASRLGMVIRDNFNMNHLDEVNQLLGLHALTDTDPLTVFRTHANRLKQAGL